MARQEGGRRAQTTIKLGSGRHAAVLAGQQRHNACTVVLLGQEGGSRHALVLVGWQQDVGGGEG
jgi:hypothetical protein